MKGDRNYKNVISICGARRNVGKTFLGEAIISHFSINHDVISVKISKFKHKTEDKENLKELYKTPHYTIWQELFFTHKDSGRYLKAGAKTSYYIECDDAHLLNAFLFVYSRYSTTNLIVCESASITKYIKPAISIFVESDKYQTEKNKLRSLQKSTLVFKERSIEISVPQIFLSVQNNKWVSKYSKNIYNYE
ncbi:hypothetical protein [Lutibacter sp.]|uniref:hypothetical protein n=1 Tax=Lutibacter sp. TaxID=1925666 RepID=UPI0025BDAE9F|nr:hypothetical protein [Lutibacter sp.]MCF6182684.1 hypothetical protein [Lutibacter sp.]